jgi:hypothetical protein
VDTPVQKLIKKIQQIKKLVLNEHSTFQRKKKNKPPLTLDRRTASVDVYS